MKWLNYVIITPLLLFMLDKHLTEMKKAKLRTVFLRQSSSTSKLEVSEGLLTSGMYGASQFRMLSQLMPEKNGCCLKSWMPFWPSRCSLLQMSLRIRSLAFSETSVILAGNWNRSYLRPWFNMVVTYKQNIKATFTLPCGNDSNLIFALIRHSSDLFRAVKTNTSKFLQSDLSHFLSRWHKSIETWQNNNGGELPNKKVCIVNVAVNVSPRHSDMFIFLHFYIIRFYWLIILKIIVHYWITWFFF